MILGSLFLLLIDGNTEYLNIIGVLCFGIILIYPSLKKDSKTESEKFIENSTDYFTVYSINLI